MNRMFVIGENLRGSQGREMIPGLAQAFFAVFNGRGGAAADTGHAVGAMAAPGGLAALQGDVVGGAEPGTLTAAGAGVADGEGFVLDEERIEEGIHRAAHEAVIEIAAGRGKRLSRSDGGDGTVDIRFRLGHDLPGLVRLRGVEHGDVVLRHDDLGGALIDQVLFPAEGTVISGGIADLAAAGHNEPGLSGVGQLRFQQPVLHKAGNTPGVGGGDEDETLAGRQRCGVAGLDAVIQAEKGLGQGVGKALGHILAVAGAGKAEYHGVLLFR